MDNITVNETVNVGDSTTITGDTITTTNISGDNITANTTFKAGDVFEVKEGDVTYNRTDYSNAGDTTVVNKQYADGLGWTLQEKGADKDKVVNDDIVNFVDGEGAKVKVETAADGKSSTVRFDVDKLGYKVNGTAATPVAISQGINFVDGTGTTAELKSNGDVTFNTKPMTFGDEDGGTFTANLDNSDAPVKVVGDGKSVKTKVENNAIKVEVDEASILEGVNLKFAGDDGSDETKVITKANGEQLDIVGGADDKASENNIYTYNDNGQIHINLAKDITGVDNITVNETVNAPTVNTTTINLGDTTNTTSITYDGERIKYGDTYVANTADVEWKAHVKKADGTAEAGTVNIAKPDFTFVEGANVTITPDATNNQITIAVDKDAILEGTEPLKFDGDSGTTVKPKHGDTVNVKGGETDEAKLTDGNIGVVADGDHTLNIRLAKELQDMTSITFNGGTTINNDGLTINDGPTITKTKVDMGGNVIQNIGDAVNDGDAVNYKQLKASRTTVTAGKNVSDVHEVETDGHFSYTIDAYDTKVEAGTGLSVTGGNLDEDNVRIYTVGLSEENQGKIDNALSSLTTAADGKKAQTLDKDNTQANFISGDNITLTPSAEGIKIATKADVTFNTINATTVNAGDTSINNDGLTINGGPTITKTKVDMGGNVIQNIGDAVNDGDAVNYKQLKASRTTVTAGKNVSDVHEVETDGHFSYTIDAYDTKVEAGTGLSVTGGNLDEDNVRIYTVGLSEENQGKIDNALSSLTTAADGKKAQTLDKDNTQANFISGDNITLTPSAEGIKIATKADVTFNTVNATTIEGDTITGDTINATTVNGDTINTQTINLGNNTTIQEGEDNRITYNTKGGDTYNIATTEDGIDFAGDDGEAIHKNLTEQLDVVGGAKNKASEYNIYTYKDGDQLRINLAKDINGVDNITVNNTVNVGGNTTITGDTITTETINAQTFKAGDTTINNEGMTINEGPSFTKTNIDVNNQQIHNVAPGEAGTDAVNVDQLNDAMNQAGDVINRMGDQISAVDSRMKKGLAGAAALAALHPLDFDPDDKLTFAAGVGNYRGANAAAVGAFYRPDEKVMFSVGGTFGNGENMVNAGVSFSLDRVPHVTNSKTAMAREILDLRREVTELKASMASGNWMLDPSLTRLFPDTEENHWAYEYVKTLAGNHIIEGYPDGEFKGDRMITRYEMAAILYRAMMNGVQLPDKALNEFAPELGRFRVDRVYGNGDARHKVERIRVNNENRKERDVYGSEYKYFKANPGANVSTGALPGTKQAERAARAEAAAK